MVFESNASSPNACLERRTAHARRRAHAGDLAGASADYAALWPQTKQLSPCRRLRFLGQYADVLARQECLLAFERIRCLAEEAESLCLDLLRRSDAPPPEAHNIRRHVHGVLGVLIKVTRKVGDDSAIGQTALERAWSLDSSLNFGTAASKVGSCKIRPVPLNGSTTWMVKEADRYRLIRRVPRA